MRRFNSGKILTELTKEVDISIDMDDLVEIIDHLNDNELHELVTSFPNDVIGSLMTEYFGQHFPNINLGVFPWNTEKARSIFATFVQIMSKSDVDLTRVEKAISLI